jgi:predicted phage terminase large subunit-like protein
MTAKPGLLGFAEAALFDQSLIPARHHKALITKLEEVSEGSCNRLMVQMPPGSAKSTYVSVLFPAYFFARHAGAQIIATAHTASLAEHFGRQLRRTIAEHGEKLGLALAKETKAAGRFSLLDGGTYFAAGVRGPITGRRADLILIDDPIKSWAEAESLVYRDALYEWYRAELIARLRPNGRVVLLMARWHEDDLAGRLMAKGSGWQNLTLPALAELGDPLGRDIGEPLWPEWQGAEAIATIRNEVGERAFTALYQQKPRRSNSALFKTWTISILAEAPPVVRTIRAWDLAATLPSAGRNPDYTVGLKLGVTEDSRLVVLDIIRMRESPAQVHAKILATAQADGTGAIVALPKDPGQAGAAQIAIFTRELIGYQVISSPETGAKVTRAMPAATQMDAGNIYFIAAPWNEAFIAELREFPDSDKDDQVDALSRAVNTLATTDSTNSKLLRIPLLGR